MHDLDGGADPDDWFFYVSPRALRFVDPKVRDLSHISQFSTRLHAQKVDTRLKDYYVGCPFTKDNVLTKRCHFIPRAKGTEHLHSILCHRILAGRNINEENESEQAVEQQGEQRQAEVKQEQAEGEQAQALLGENGNDEEEYGGQGQEVAEEDMNIEIDDPRNMIFLTPTFCDALDKKMLRFLRGKEMEDPNKYLLTIHPLIPLPSFLIAAWSLNLSPWLWGLEWHHCTQPLILDISYATTLLAAWGPTSVLRDLEAEGKKKFYGGKKAKRSGNPGHQKEAKRKGDKKQEDEHAKRRERHLGCYALDAQYLVGTSPEAVEERERRRNARAIERWEEKVRAALS
ncbi:uncharacterized protein EI90DRAFT_3126600 [Cantharellus anzutake]|uniref:uncharacterized protein n=1 Tax=Cantharellus anzutake TaxID=1750568 RepID=UPI00190363F4|nr:uncharacterized protein EI90DRAFT_3126600 [Cantharellus anzutake]KAF8327954.1 hypothetical protein EI90DRAFT_3126600 [Cantharellus anzutake]